jgi:hypothetical protein
VAETGCIREQLCGIPGAGPGHSSRAELAQSSWHCRLSSFWKELMSNLSSNSRSARVVGDLHSRDRQIVGGMTSIAGSENQNGWVQFTSGRSSSGLSLRGRQNESISLPSEVNPLLVIQFHSSICTLGSAHSVLSDQVQVLWYEGSLLDHCFDDVLHCIAREKYVLPQLVDGVDQAQN